MDVSATRGGGARWTCHRPRAGRKLGHWLGPFLARLRRKVQRRWASLYLKGLLLPGERKSVEPLAARVAPADTQQLHQGRGEFLFGAVRGTLNCHYRTGRDRARGTHSPPRSRSTSTPQASASPATLTLQQPRQAACSDGPPLRLSTTLPPGALYAGKSKT
jgi:hypothetical protein